MRLLKLATSVAFISVSTTPALADEVRPYIGPIVGWDHVTIKSPIGGSKDGFTYGGVIGADYVFRQNYVIGAEVEATGSTTKEPLRNAPGNSDGSGSLSAGRDLYAGVRFGLAVTPHVLAYTKGGYTNVHATVHFSDRAGGFEASENLDGWRIGVGAEVSLKKFRVRLEYRYSHYGAIRDTYGFDTYIQPKRHQVVAGILLNL